MQKFMTGVAALALTSGAAYAGGIERSNGSVSFMFDEGTVAIASVGFVNPTVSGTAAGGALSSGDAGDSYNVPSLSFKTDVNENLSFGIVLDTPVGAAITYPTGTGWPVAGATASVDSKGITAIGKYNFNENVSVYAGIRRETVEGSVAGVPVAGVGLYSLSTDTSNETGYLVGAAYERKDIALRVALTYSNAIDHTLTTTELGNPSGTMEVTTPESWNLEFQSGVAADTLVFGNIKYRKWSEFDISPNLFALGTGGGSLVDLDDNVTTFNLGVGRRINDQLSLALSAGYEKSNGGISGNLTPTDGQRSISLSGSYDINANVQLRGGVSYIKIGDAETRLGVVPTDFSDNSATAFGVSLKYSF